MKRFFYFYVIILTLYLFSCGENSTNPNNEYGIIDGIVVDESLNPMKNVEIYTIPGTEVLLSNDSGKFVLNNVPEGQYSMYAKKTAYITKTLEVGVIKGKTSSVTLIMKIDSSMFNKPPSKPKLIQPINNDIVTRNVTLKWSASDPDKDILTYELYFGKSLNNLSLVVSNYDTNFYVMNNLDVDTEYFWKVVVKDTKNEPVSSDIWKFKVENLSDNFITLNLDFDNDFADKSNYKQNVSNSNVVLTTDRYGSENSAAYFDGTSHLEVVNPTYMDFSQPFTVCAWIKLNQVNYNDTFEGEMDIVSRIRGAEYYKSSFAIYIKYGLLRGVIYNNSYGSTYLESSTYIKDNIWTHVAYVYDGNQLLLYENAKLVANKNSSQPDKSNLNLFIGVRAQGNRFFIGQMDDIFVVSKALDNDEINQIMNK